MDGLFNAMNISSSGMAAERLRLNIISQNLANAETTKTDSGDPYRRKSVVFKEVLNSELSGTDSYGGVRVEEVQEDLSPFKIVYDPTNPQANEEGYVEMPNVNVLKEMVDMINAQRAYELNASAVSAAKAMYNAGLNIGK
ncbi:MAG TPA: flagellar basal body rod protein FlgC [Tepiditoga sp.]|nr:flagellar basal body rod protein FlgC [Tepiditoga sp.]